MRRLARSVLLAGTVALVAYLGVTFGQVWASSARDEARLSDAIVVLGAAQYDGRPSPSLERRLDHARELFDAQLAAIIVVTGGNRPGDRFHEAYASAVYLQARGVDADAILWEVQGRNTWEQMAATARILRSRGLREVVLVTDPMHAERVRATAGEVGLRAAVSPRGSDASTGAKVRAAVRETFAVAVGRLIGFRRLAQLGTLGDDVTPRA